MAGALTRDMTICQHQLSGEYLATYALHTSFQNEQDNFECKYVVAVKLPRAFKSQV